MTKIIDGRKIKNEILENLKKQVLDLPFVPVFCDILVGDDTVSSSYVKIKSSAAVSIGIKFRTAEFPESITTDALIEEIEKLNRVPHMCGIIVQLPLPKHIDKNCVLNAIDPLLDVDCLGEVTSKNFYSNNSIFSYPTAMACMSVLDSLNLDLSNKKILVLGTGMLVGRPVAHLLHDRGLDIETANNQTSNIYDLIKNSDVIISAIGDGKFITGSMIKKDAVIIDAGTSEEDGGIVGDTDVKSIEGVASFITPTPGGVGPITVAMLLKNILISARNKSNVSVIE